MKIALPIISILTILHAENATSVPSTLPNLPYHLTSRPWHAVEDSLDGVKQQLDDAMHALAPQQDAKSGIIIDLYEKKEVQYSTPLFAFNVATLLNLGRASDLAEAGAKALDACTNDIATGMANDYHGEFYCAPMCKAIRLFEKVSNKFPQVVTKERVAEWKKRMSLPREKFMSLRVRQNWRTFAMKGEWLREQDGYIKDGTKWNELCWTSKVEGGQRERFFRDKEQYKISPYFLMYHDDTADPETFAYNGATTANLLDMLENGYAGKSAKEMRDTVAYSLHGAMNLLGASGEAPAGGRTGEHIWDDTVYAIGFEMMAEIEHKKGNDALAGQYRRAVTLLLASHSRFQQERGWFSITKNQFPSAYKNRYASWSGLTNYNGYTLACLSEIIAARKSKIPQSPAPYEIGGYSITLDPEFSNTFLNAGGMQAQVCTRGETDAYGNVQWHTLGITRISRTGWESRLGPAAGHINLDFSDAVSLCPAYFENGKWNRLCSVPKQYQGIVTTEFVHPLLTKATVHFSPVKGQSGANFEMKMTITPDGILLDTSCDDSNKKIGVVLPMLDFDGKTQLTKSYENQIAAISYPVKIGKPQIFSGSSANFSSEQSGDTTLGIRYQFPSDVKATASAELSVNGQKQNITFISSAEADNFHVLEIPITLQSGANQIQISNTIASIKELRLYTPSEQKPDQQNYISLSSTSSFDASAPLVRGGYGDFRPVILSDEKEKIISTWIYPRNGSDTPAADVLKSFQRNGDDFSTAINSVQGKIYIGKTSAGGFGKLLDIDHDGTAEIIFDRECSFITQLKNGKIIALETDQDAKAKIDNHVVSLKASKPFMLTW